MRQATANSTQGRELFEAAEAYTGQKFPSYDDLVRYCDEQGQKVGDLLREAERGYSDAPTAVPADWHPEWCAHTEHCTPLSRDGNIHYSKPRTLVPGPTPTYGPASSEDFTLGVAAVALEEYGEVYDSAALLTLRSEETPGVARVHMGTQTMRELADWLMEQADIVDDAHAGKRAQMVDPVREEAHA